MSAATPAPVGATGPRTPEGRAVSSQNATSHGLTSERTVLAHEDQDEFDKLLYALIDEFQPNGPHEGFLVCRMADTQWRLERAERIENALFALMIEDDKTNSSPEVAIARAMMSRSGDPLSNLQRYVSSLDRSYHRYFHELIQGRKMKKVADAKCAEADLISFLNARPPLPSRATGPTPAQTPRRPAENRALRL